MTILGGRFRARQRGPYVIFEQEDTLPQWHSPFPPFGTVNPAPAEVARVAAEQDWPRLRIRWSRVFRAWCWRVAGPGGEHLDDGIHDTWAEALAVGLAALEQATAGWRA